MIRSHLVDAFLSTPWYLHQDVHGRLSDLLEAHLLGRKDDLRAREVATLSFQGDATDAGGETAADHLVGDVAVIEVRGVLAPHADQVNGECQPRGRSYESIAAQLDLAEADPAVRAIVLRLETPGGAAVGCQELYERLKASAKPVHAYVSGYCFSAGYYLASACASIVASSAIAQTGSIGTVMALWDTAAADEKRGMRRVVIRSGPYKALGQDGEPITDLVRGELQRTCDAFAAAFYDAVRAGRGITDAQGEQVLNGRTFTAADAMALGLVDGIKPFTDYLSSLTETAMFGRSKPTPITAVALAELVAAHQDHAQIILGMAKDGADEAAIRAAVAQAAAAAQVEAQAAALTAAVAARATAEAALAKATTDHAAAIAAKDGEIAALKAELAQAKEKAGIAAGAAKDPGPGAVDASLRRSQMTRAAKAAYQREHGAAAYQRLPE